MLYYERKLRDKGVQIIIGVDEAGRGPLAGPVVAAAVVLLTFSFRNRIDDSKKLTSALRDAAFGEIIKKSRYSIAIVDEKTIDRINILQATRSAMAQAVNDLLKQFDVPVTSDTAHVLVDGAMHLDIPIPHTSIIQGDAKSKSIASASILAKVTRDRIMDAYAVKFPLYHFENNKGYPTQEHREIIKKIGLSEIHRKTFTCG